MTQDIAPTAWLMLLVKAQLSYTVNHGKEDSVHLREDVLAHLGTVLDDPHLVLRLRLPDLNGPHLVVNGRHGGVDELDVVAALVDLLDSPLRKIRDVGVSVWYWRCRN